MIEVQAQRLNDDFGYVPVTAAELEFYLPGAEACAQMDAFWKDVASALPSLEKYEKERGREQFEIALSPADPATTAADVARAKDIMAACAPRYNMRADFSAKPFVEEPGSGLHIHIHLTDAAGKNIFYKDDNTIGEPLKHCIGGLLAWLPETMPIFAPHAESYLRFTAKSNAPTTASWGGNNRTVAIRLPDKPHDKKHIEHRVAGADADPQRVIAVILAAMHDGLTRTLDPGAQIYGDAALAMYRLPPLPQSLEAARRQWQESAAIGKYFASGAL